MREKKKGRKREIVEIARSNGHFIRENHGNSQQHRSPDTFTPPFYPELQSGPDNNFVFNYRARESVF